VATRVKIAALTLVILVAFLAIIISPLIMTPPIGELIQNKAETPSVDIAKPILKDLSKNATSVNRYENLKRMAIKRTIGFRHDLPYRIHAVDKILPTDDLPTRRYKKIWNELVAFDQNSIEADYLSGSNFIPFIDQNKILDKLIANDFLDAAWWLIDHNAKITNDTLSSAGSLVGDYESKDDL